MLQGDAHFIRILICFVLNVLTALVHVNTCCVKHAHVQGELSKLL